MTRAAAYHSLMRSVQSDRLDDRTLLRDSIKSILQGFVSNDVYWAASAAVKSGRTVRACARELTAMDINPVALLLRASTDMDSFIAGWNGFHSKWMLAVDTQLRSSSDGSLAYRRQSPAAVDVEAICEKVIEGVIEEIAPRPLLRVAGPTVQSTRDAHHPALELLRLGAAGGMTSALIYELLALLSEDLSTSITAAATRLRMSTRRLQRELQKNELVFPEVRTACRLLKAAHLLRTSRCSVTEVALDCGFFDSAHFARSFVVSTGVSATEYRAIADAMQTGGRITAVV